MQSKRTIIVALALLAGATFAGPHAIAKEKKKKKKGQPVVAVVEPPVQLLSSSDSVSYAAGKMLTDGLIGYVQTQLHVDTAYMADFVAGFRQAVESASDPAQKARMAGMTIAGQVMESMIPRVKTDFTGTPDTINSQLLLRGFTDAVSGRDEVMQQKAATEFFRQKKDSNHAALIEAQQRAGRLFLEQNKQNEGVIVCESGLQYQVLVKGDGQVPQATDRVRVHYEGRLIDGTVFDASSKHGTEPAVFAANQVIRGWTEALTMMPVGSKWRLFIPHSLAYGDRAAGQIPPYSTLIFDVELVGIDK